MSNEQKVLRKKYHRSRGYPSIDLEAAISASRHLYEAEGLNFMPAEVAVRHLGYSPKASSGIRAIAALTHYGLLEKGGTGKGKLIRLSGLAKRILLDERPDSEDRNMAIAEAALSPDLHKELWEKWKPKLPSDASIKHELVFEQHFNPEIVQTVIGNFRASIGLAKLEKSRILSEMQEDKADDNGGEPDEDFGSGEETRMPQVRIENTKAFDLPIFLSTGQATLRLPVPLSSKDFEHLKEALKSGLDGLQKAFVTDPGPRAYSEGKSD